MLLSGCYVWSLDLNHRTMVLFIVPITWLVLIEINASIRLFDKSSSMAAKYVDNNILLGGLVTPTLGLIKK